MKCYKPDMKRLTFSLSSVHLNFRKYSIAHWYHNLMSSTFANVECEKKYRNAHYSLVTESINLEFMAFHFTWIELLSYKCTPKLKHFEQPMVGTPFHPVIKTKWSACEIFTSIYLRLSIPLYESAFGKTTFSVFQYFFLIVSYILKLC